MCSPNSRRLQQRGESAATFSSGILHEYFVSVSASLYLHRIENCDRFGLAGDYCCGNCDVGDYGYRLLYLECLPAKLHQRNSVSGFLHWGCWFVARSADGLVAAKDCSPSRKVVLSYFFGVGRSRII